MALSAFIQAKSFVDVGNPVSFSLTSNVTTGSNLFVYTAVINTGATATSVTDSASNPYTLIVSYSLTVGSLPCNIAVFQATNVTGGALSISVHGSASMQSVTTIAEYSTGTMVLDQNVSAVAGASVHTLTTGNVTTTVNDEILMAFTFVPNQTFGSTFTAGSGYTIESFLVENSTLGTGQSLEDQTVAVTGSYNAQITWGGGLRDAGMCLLTFALTGGPPPPTAAAYTVIIVG